MGLVLCAALAASPAGVEVSHRKVLASDGVALALYRYAPPQGLTAHPPVLLFSDFGLGRAAYDFQGRGLARWLAQHGRVAYVAELRGQGKAAGVPWAAPEVLARDLPALAAAMPAGDFDLIVHGWAGTLAMAGAGKELGGRVRKVVALSAPSEFAVPSRLAEAVLLSGGRLSSLALDPEGAVLFDLLFAMGARLDPAWRTALDDLGPRGSASLLQWMKAGDLRLETGESLKGRLLAYDRPTLQLIGLADGWANAELCANLREVSKAKVRMRVFSKFDFGVTEDYAHLSLLQGRAAPTEVWRPALAFLNEAPP